MTSWRQSSLLSLVSKVWKNILIFNLYLLFFPYNFDKEYLFKNLEDGDMDPETGTLKKDLPFKLEDILMGRKKEDSYSFF